MLPYFDQPSFALGPIRIHAFGIMVATAVLVGWYLAERRIEKLDLDRLLGDRMIWWLLIGGFLGAHLFSVFFYFPDKLARDPLIVLRVWEDIASFGSIVGGIIGVWLFFMLRARVVSPRDRLAYLDVCAFVFPVSLMLGRIGCALAHDHPGTITRFPLAVSLESAEAQQYITRVYENAGRVIDFPPGGTLAQLGFHDLGIYEFLYLAAVVVPVVLLAGKRRRAPGFFLAIFVALYMPVRFGLDFLRVSDARYAGLTPAQWGALASLAMLVGILLRRRLVVSGGSEPMTQG